MLKLAAAAALMAVLAFFLLRHHQAKHAPRAAADKRNPLIVEVDRDTGANAPAHRDTTPLYSRAPEVPARAPKPPWFTEKDLLNDPYTGQKLPWPMVHLHACHVQKLCPPNTYCAMSPDHEIGCYASNCRTIGDTKSCGENEVCFSQGPIFRCAPEGTAEAGHECVHRLGSPNESVCKAGLVCWGGRCRSACDGSCRQGEVCTPVGDSKVCIAKGELCARDEECPAGEICLSSEASGGKRLCTTLGTFADGTLSCKPGGCPERQACEGPVYGRTLYARCLQRCSTEQECPSGSSCGALKEGVASVKEAPAVCWQTCRLYHKEDCPPGYGCGAIQQPQITACVPSPPVQRDIRMIGYRDSIYAEPPVSRPQINLPRPN